MAASVLHPFWPCSLLSNFADPVTKDEISQSLSLTGLLISSSQWNPLEVIVSQFSVKWFLTFSIWVVLLKPQRLVCFHYFSLSCMAIRTHCLWLEDAFSLTGGWEARRAELSHPISPRRGWPGQWTCKLCERAMPRWAEPPRLTTSVQTIHV